MNSYSSLTKLLYEIIAKLYQTFLEVLNTRQLKGYRPLKTSFCLFSQFSNTLLSVHVLFTNLTTNYTLLIEVLQ